MDDLIAQAGNLAVSPPAASSSAPAPSSSLTIAAADAATAETRRRERQQRFLRGTTVRRSSTISTASRESEPLSAAGRTSSSSSVIESSSSSSVPSCPPSQRVAARSLDCVVHCRLLPLEGPEFLVRWTNGEESWEHFGTVAATAAGTAELRDYYIRTMPDDIWQDTLGQRSRESQHMVLQLAKLKRLLPAADAPLMAQFDQVERAMGNMSLLTDTAASIAAQSQIIRWRIMRFMDVMAVLDDLPHGEYFKTFEEFKAATHKAYMAKHELHAAEREERRLERVDALSASPNNSTEATVIR